MIPRYSNSDMTEIWSEKNKLNIWLKVELAACEAMEKEGVVADGTTAFLNDKLSGFPTDEDVDAVLEIEKECKHDVIAFLTRVEQLAGNPGRFLHLGLTSSDVLDTTVAVQFKQSFEKIIIRVKSFLEVIKKRAFEFKYTPEIGRSHGIHAEPITFGFKLAGFYTQLQRDLIRLIEAEKEISYGKISGAVGTFANVTPTVEKHVMDKLGLKPDPVSTQIVSRDRHAQALSAIAILGSTMERIAVEIRHLQRTEVAEVQEAFSKGQKGSSAMPHKKNPILSENLSGLARLLRTNALAAIENVALWHERDISHSSVERVIAPDSTILAEFMLKRLTNLVDCMVVDKDNMMKNLELTGGLIFSQSVLIELAKKGLARQEAYVMVQRNAMKAASDKTESDFSKFKEYISTDKDICNYLTSEEIEKCFSLDNHFKHIDVIFDRVFN